MKSRKYPGYFSHERESKKMMAPEDLLELFYSLDPSKIVKKICNINGLFDDIIFIKNKGSSISTPFFAHFNEEKLAKQLIKKIPKDQVFVKVCVEKKTEHTYLQEAYAYFFVAELVRLHRSPNFLKIIAYFECEDLGNPQIQKFNPLMETPNSDYLARILVIEKGVGDSMENHIEKMSSEELLSAIFQVGFTIREMNLHGLRHNDLHLGNVWISSKPEKMVTYVASKDQKYCLEPFVKIFDFDLSFFTGSVVPDLNEYVISKAPEWGMFPKTNFRFDFFRFMYSLWTYTTATSKHRKLVEGIFDRLAIDKKWNPKYDKSGKLYTRYGAICKALETKLGKGLCDPDFVVLEKEMMSFTDLLEETSLFDRFLVDSPKGIVYTSRWAE